MRIAVMYRFIVNCITRWNIPHRVISIELSDMLRDVVNGVFA